MLAFSAEHQGANCFSCERNCKEIIDHGGKTSPGPEPYSKSISLSACQAACSADANCTAIVAGSGKHQTAAVGASENSTARMKAGSGELPSTVAGLGGSAVTVCPQLVA